jgi:hypothetical protein
MALRSIMVQRYEEIQQRLVEGPQSARDRLRAGVLATHGARIVRRGVTDWGTHTG